MSRHLVSVIVPAWNMARFLPDTIASIPQVHEIIIVAAESKDDTQAVAAELSRQRRDVRVVRGSDESPAIARNIGLAKASGDIIAFADADDLWPPGKLAFQLSRLDRNPKVDVVAGLVTYFDRLDSHTLTPSKSSRTHTIFFHHLGATIFRRSVFERVGHFDETLRYGEDRDLFLRLVEFRIPLVILNAAMLFYRRHGDSMMTRDDPRKKSDDVRVYALSLARRRRLGIDLAPLDFESYLEDIAGEPHPL
jgi:glycosyltransferase involved in cell wall biosynthesis